MSLKTIKYFSTLIVAVVAVLAAWWLWNYYMQSPWTRDGKIRAEQVSVTPQVSGSITQLNIKDNQFVNAGDVLFVIDKTPFHIAELNAQAQLAKAQSDLAKANNEADRRRHLSRNYISAEDLDSANLNVKAMQANVDVALATLKQAQWQLSQTEVKAPVSGWVTNLSTRTGDYASTGKPLFALVDSHSFYVMGYFEETKLRHIREGEPALITLYSGNIKLQGHVGSIGRAIYDQSVESDSGLVPDIKPNVPWVRLALTFAYYLNLDEPYWAMTSAAVVSFPTVGGVISKSLGRIAGSLLGATAALIIAGHTLNEPWLFLFSMAAWIGFCTWACAHFTNNAAYAFQLSGYTAAIIAFPMVNIVEITQLWDIAQARVCEVIVGILCGGMMMMILPSTSDGTALLTALKNMHARLLEHASLLWQPETTDAIRSAHEGVIGQILTMNLLRIQAFWSHYRFRRQNALLNALLHQQLRLTSVISSLRRMLLNWPTPPENSREVIEQLLAALAKPRADSYTVARIIAPLRPQDEQDYRHLAFWQRLRYFCHLYLRSSRQLYLIESGAPVDQIHIRRTPGLARHTDNAEAIWSGVRTFCTLTVIGAWSIGAQWESGPGALTLAAISCVLYSIVATPFKSLTLLMRTLVLLSLFSFVVKFGLMVQITDLWQFLLFLFPLFVTMQLLKLQMPKLAGLWGQLIVFMGSFIAVTNPPVYDFADFLNDNTAKIVGVAISWLAFAILRPGSDAVKSRRHIRALRRDFVDQLSRHPSHSESEFESLTYHHVSQLSNSQDALARRWLLRWGVVLLNCSHVVWQLRAWESRSDPLSRVRDICISLLRDVMSERGVQQRPLAVTLQELQRICDTLAHHHQPAAHELAAIIWRLYCSLSQLEQAPAQGTLSPGYLMTPQA
ncbi:efflux RND transporter periplasmic adaptor subunit [Salmonella enterica]|nr:efflux RND transporter periplasmic adaptor subunit [Salmonella enterica]